MFGGECIDPISGKVQTFNDLYRYQVDKDRWVKVISPNRCGSVGGVRGVDGLHHLGRC